MLAPFLNDQRRPFRLAVTAVRYAFTLAPFLNDQRRPLLASHSLRFFVACLRLPCLLPPSSHLLAPHSLRVNDFSLHVYGRLACYLPLRIPFASR
jgi:hypothetical protein